MLVLRSQRAAQCLKRRAQENDEAERLVLVVVQDDLVPQVVQDDPEARKVGHLRQEHTDHMGAEPEDVVGEEAPVYSCQDAERREEHPCERHEDGVENYFVRRVVLYGEVAGGQVDAKLQPRRRRMTRGQVSVHRDDDVVVSGPAQTLLPAIIAAAEDERRGAAGPGDGFVLKAVVLREGRADAEPVERVASHGVADGDDAVGVQHPPGRGSHRPTDVQGGVVHDDAVVQQPVVSLVPTPFVANADVGELGAGGQRVKVAGPQSGGRARTGLHGGTVRAGHGGQCWSGRRLHVRRRGAQHYFRRDLHWRKGDTDGLSSSSRIMSASAIRMLCATKSDTDVDRSPSLGC
eukprot:scaffold2069_cov254-Pinguiococcus_pyrenoidosus.AAC.13